MDVRTRSWWTVQSTHKRTIDYGSGHLASRLKLSWRDLDLMTETMDTLLGNFSSHSKTKAVLISADRFALFLILNSVVDRFDGSFGKYRND